MPLAGETIIAGRVPGERIETTVVTSDSSGFTTTEVSLATVTAALVTGRTYRVTFDGGFQTTVESTLRLTIRENSLAGTQMQIRDYTIGTASGTVYQCHIEAEFTAVATGDKTFALTGDVLAGGGTVNLNAAGNFPSYLYVDYIRG